MKSKKGDKTCKKCGQIILDKEPSITPLALTADQEDEIIENITKKAIKATMTKLKPLLDKLEEAAKQQAQERAASQNNTTDALSYQEQIQNIQNAAKERIQLQELKISKRMQNLQSKIVKRG